MELNNRIVHYKDAKDIDKQYFSLSYQKQFLKNSKSWTHIIIEYLDLEQKTFRFTELCISFRFCI